MFAKDPIDQASGLYFPSQPRSGMPKLRMLKAEILMLQNIQELLSDSTELKSTVLVQPSLLLKRKNFQ